MWLLVALVALLLCGAIGLGLIVFSLSCMFKQEEREYNERNAP
jgi:hypothetical protein